MFAATFFRITVFSKFSTNHCIRQLFHRIIMFVYTLFLKSRCSPTFPYHNMFGRILRISMFGHFPVSLHVRPHSPNLYVRPLSRITTCSAGYSESLCSATLMYHYMFGHTLWITMFSHFSESLCSVTSPNHYVRPLSRITTCSATSPNHYVRPLSKSKLLRVFNYNMYSV